MSSSVIDALVVTLGLDSKGFSDGIQGATASLTGFATKVAGLALGFKGLEAGIQYFENLHKKLSDLYFTGRNLGVFGTELSRLGELAKLFGGNMEDATGSVNTLQSAVFNLRFKGQMSESLMMLQRFGIDYLDAQGHMRDPEAIARDAAVAIQRRAPESTSGERFQIAQSFGLQGGLASAAAAGPAEFDAMLARARADQGRHGKIPGLTEGTLRGQAMLDRDITSRRQQRDNEMAQVLNKLLPALETLNEWLQKLAQKGIEMGIGGLDAATNFLQHPPPWFSKTESALKDLSDRLGPNGPLVVAIGGLATTIGLWKLLGAGAGMGAPVLGQLGLAAGAGVGVGYGLDWLDEKLGGHTFNALGRWSLFSPSTWQNYDPNSSPIARGQINRPPVTPTAPRPPGGAAASKPTAMNGAGTSITFENVTVNSRGQDGATLAREFTGAVKRSINASLSDAGLYS